MYYDPKESGKRIAALRKDSSMTQEQLAEKLNISDSMISKIERGAKGVSIDLAIEICAIFNVSLDYLILGKAINVDDVRVQLRNIARSIEELEKSI